jgi:branched-chain amino acid transport system substrate-binding protein
MARQERLASSRRRKAHVSVAMVLLLVLLAACSKGGGSKGTTTSSGGSKGTIKIGALMALTGDFSSIGTDSQNGFQLYLDEHHGKLGGYTVDLVTKDTQADPHLALQKAQELIQQDHVSVITGLASSLEALSIRNLIDSAKVPLVISTEAGANAITSTERSDYIWRVTEDNYQGPYEAGKWTAQNVSKSVWLVDPDYAAGQECAAGFKLGVEAGGGTVVKNQLIPPFGATADFQPYLTAIKQANPGAVLMFDFGPDDINWVRQYDQFGLKGQIPIVGFGLTDEDVLQQEGNAAIGIQSFAHWASTVDNPTNKKFVSDFLVKYGYVPSVYAVHGYDGAHFIDLALATVNSTDPTVINDALAKVKPFDSPRGRLEMDVATHEVVNPIYLLKVEETAGKLVNVVQQLVATVREPQNIPVAG